ncbi:uncharacterized protein LOC111264650 isoform X3 [Varroa jacobsoni]|uniref:uncharacterized protein LOC111264650 isoform X3 n=1 Tax=Varroa jacobsoni TaxID=62625 RepID=UPI000BF33158|nr:uncharacterized protein LOC111264650 isoform X3 [Varroa jacobsoni]
MPALSSMWPSQLLLVAIFIQQTCFSAQMKAHLEGELTPRMDFSFQGSNPINHLTGALGNNVANLFNPMQAVNAAFNAINGILKPAIPLTLPPTQLEFSSLLGFPRRSNGASLFPHTNSGNPPMSGSGSGIASLSVHNLGTNQPASRSTNEASVSFHTSMNNSPTTNPGSFGFSISGNGLDTGSRESPGSVSTSISRANIRLDPDATASSGPSRPSLGINLASSSSSSEFNFKSSTAARKNPEFNSYYEGAYCNVKSPFTLLKSERLGEKTKYYHCIDGAMVAVICPTDKPALQDMCDGYAKHCWRYLAFDRSMTHEQINNNAYDYYTCLGKIPQGS